MHRHSNTLIASLALLLALLNSPTPASAQAKLTAEDWIEDVRYLQQTVHTDYPHLFDKISAEDFDAQVDRLVADVPSLARHEIVVGIARLVAAFQYGHTSLHLFGDEIGFARAPLNIYHFADGVYIEGAAPEHADLVGARIVAVEGVPVEQAIDQLAPAFPVENSQFLKAYGMRLLTTPAILHAQGLTPKLAAHVRYRLAHPDGREADVTVQVAESTEAPTSYGFIPPNQGWATMQPAIRTPHYLDSLDQHYYHRYLPEHNVVYVRYSQVIPDRDRDIETLFRQVFKSVKQQEADKLVLDVRLNGGGDNTNNITVIKQLLAEPEINQVGKVFVLIGRRTFSACQNLVNELDTYGEVIFVGEPTGENVNFWGDNRPVTLPNSQLAPRLSWAWWQDQPQWKAGAWTAPHLPVELTAAQYSAGEDPVLAKALAFQEENFVRDPMGYIRTLFTKGDVALLQSEIMRMVPSPTYSFFDFEGQFDAAGKQLHASGQRDAALQVFSMNYALFPESSVTANSLAGIFLEVGDRAEATRLFREAYRIAPESAAGLEAKARLDSMNKE